MAVLPDPPSLQALGSHMGASSFPGYSASHLAPCLWPGKAVEDSPKPRDPVPAWETRKRFLALVLDWRSTGRCDHLGSES